MLKKINSRKNVCVSWLFILSLQQFSIYSRKFYNLSMRIDGLKIDGIANIEH